MHLFSFFVLTWGTSHESIFSVGNFAASRIGKDRYTMAKKGNKNTIAQNNVVTTEIEIAPSVKVEVESAPLENVAFTGNADKGKQVLHAASLMVIQGYSWQDAYALAGLELADGKALAKIMDCEFTQGRRSLSESDFGTSTVDGWVREYESGVSLIELSKRDGVPSQTVLARFFNARGIELTRGRKATEIDDVLQAYNAACGTPDGTLLDMIHAEYGTSEKRVSILGRHATPALCAQSISFKIGKSVPTNVIQSELVKLGLYETKTRKR